MWRACFTSYLKQGYFPDKWKRARLILLKKEGKQDLIPSSYRPICLLDESGKLFENIIAKRITDVLERNEGLSENQFGFRSGRSTTEAIISVRNKIKEYLEEYDFVLAVNIDITNAFNSLPWVNIKEALIACEIPEYLHAIINSYLNNRKLMFIDRDSHMHVRRVTSGVPQRSVLGRLLWNITYSVLRLELPEGCTVKCYADDTLVIISGKSIKNLLAKADLPLSMVCAEIKRQGLKISPTKLEVIIFHGRRRAFPDNLRLCLDGEAVAISRSIKYLGIVIDSHWNFKEHFRLLLPRVERVAVTRLMPNLKGPSERRKRLRVYHTIYGHVRRTCMAKCGDEEPQNS